MSTVVAMRREFPTRLNPNPNELSVVVGGGHGGSTATTTTIGIATALADRGITVVAADGTSDGGNLFERSAADRLSPQKATLTAGLTVSSALSTAGVIVCDTVTDSTMFDSIVADRGAARVFDVGTALDTTRMVTLRRTAVVVLTSTARAEPLSRLRASLNRLRHSHGPDALARTVVLISHTSTARAVDLTAVHDGLAPVVAALIEVDFDPALAAPGPLDASRVAASTTGRWAAAADAITAVHHNQYPRKEQA